MHTNKAYGYTENLEQYRIENNLVDYDVGRVIAEHKSRYVVKADGFEYSAEIIGNLRYSANSRADFPAVGDWVVFVGCEDGNALIYQVLPRHSMLERQQVHDSGERQMIATNIDTALIVVSVNRDFSLNRIERYLTICFAAKIKAVLVLNKVDLVNDLEVVELLAKVTARLPDLPVLAFSNVTGQGVEQLDGLLEKGRTYCLLGSSGVGKSTLLNVLMGKSVMQTGEISDYAERGKHVTTHRELNMTPNGVLVIDNPGMREIGLTNGGLEETFGYVEQLAMMCKFNDCSHLQTAGCAIQSAIKTDELEQETFNRYLKMQREQAHFTTKNSEKKQKYKALTKQHKSFAKNMRKITKSNRQR